MLKDFTSTISQNKDTRAMLLAALREVHDGRWTRNVGVDGGRTLTWTGRLVIIGAVTTAYDQAHAVIASMGDRFALVRLASGAGPGRLAAGAQALSNVDHEQVMRRELADATAAVLAGADPSHAELDGAAGGEITEPGRDCGYLTLRITCRSAERLAARPDTDGRCVM